jgi:hypothetical protein
MTDDQARAAESKQVLARIARDSETLGTSSLARSVKNQARRAEDHFMGRDASEGTNSPPDPAELWGRRVGRALSLISVMILAFMLGRMLQWW